MDISAFFKVTYGLYLVCSKEGNNFNGHISNTVFQVTADPPQFVVATHKNNLTTAYIRKSRLFSVSVLKQDIDLEFIGPWGFKSGRNTDKFKDISFRIGITGAPVIIEKTIAFIECEVIQEIDTGTHILFVGKAVNAEVVDDKAIPLTYSYYREVIKGISPENSPTYTGNLQEKEVTGGNATLKEMPGKYQCKVCGFIYDPEIGDIDSGIPPGTAFENIPDDWSCPICGVSKKDFIRID